MDTFNKLKSKYPAKFNSIKEIFSSFTDDEIAMLSPYIRAYTRTDEMNYTLLPTPITVLRGFNLLEDIYKIKAAIARHDKFPKLESVTHVTTIEMYPGIEVLCVKMQGINVTYEFETRDSYL